MAAHAYTPNSLFRGDANWKLNACVGSNGGPYDYEAYAHGFFQAGFNIIEKIKSGAWTIDVLVYPAAFNFRHGIELYIKHMLIVSHRILETGGNMNFGHQINDNWKDLCGLFQKLDKAYFSKSDIDIVSSILDDFLKIDKDGQVFRYPKDRKGNLTLEGISLINICVLGDAMNEVYELFETWGSGLVHLCESKGISPCSTTDA